MRAVVIRNRGVVVEDVDDPVPGSGQVVVGVAAAGLNAADLHQVAGTYPPPPGWPEDIPGMEFAGRILSTGPGVTSWAPGDRVMALVGGGAHAEKALAPVGALMRIPESVGFEAAAGFPEGFTTGWDALVAQAGLRAGDRVLVTGSTGGVGTAALQIASLSGAEVVASVRDPGAGPRLSALAPGVIVVHAGSEDEHSPYDVILELVGGEASMERIGLLAFGGRIVVIGVGAGARVPIPLGRLMAVRGQVMASTLRARPEWEKSALARRVEHALVPSLATGRISVPIDSTFRLESAASAYARMAESGKFGKVILTTGS